jgi:hypothetical protein
MACAPGFAASFWWFELIEAGVQFLVCVGCLYKIIKLAANLFSKSLFKILWRILT